MPKMMNLRYLIAARYVRSRKSHSVINIISGVSIVAMAAPVAAMIILLSVFNGLEGMVRQLYTAVDADVRITPREGTTFVASDLDTAAMASTGCVEALSFVLEQGAMAEAGGQRAIVEVKGVDENYTRVVPVAESLVGGTFTVASDETRSAVAGYGVMQELQLSRQGIGSLVQLYAINRRRISSLLPTGGYTRREMPVAGIYSVDQQNDNRIFVSMDAAQDLFNYPDRASAVEIKLRAGVDASAAADKIRSIAGEQMKVLTREQGNSIYRLMALEKVIVFLVAVVVLLIASLSMVGTLIMLIMDKRDDAQTLRVMGARERFIRRIFVGEGELLAVAALAAGLVIGITLTLAQQHWGIIRLDAQSLMVDAYPVELRWGDVALTVVAYLGVSLVITRLTVGGMLKRK